MDERDRLESLSWQDQDLFCGVVRTVLEDILEAEMTEALGAERGERTEGRLGWRSGYCARRLVTRVGVSTRKVRAITEELCGHTFSASTISRINQGLDERVSSSSPAGPWRSPTPTSSWMPLANGDADRNRPVEP